MTIANDCTDEAPALNEEIAAIMEKISRLENEIESMSDKMSSCQGGDESDRSTSPTGVPYAARSESGMKFESSPSHENIGQEGEENDTELSSNSMIGTYLEGSSSSPCQGSDHAVTLPQASTRGRHVSTEGFMPSVDCNFRQTPSYHTSKSTHSKKVNNALISGVGTGELSSESRLSKACVASDLVVVENADEIEKLRRQYTKSPVEFPRELLARDDKYRTKLATALEESRTEMVTFLLSLGAAISMFVHDSRPQTILCTIPFARHPPDTETMSIAGGILAQNWRMLRGRTCPDDILALLDKELEIQIRKVSQFSRLHDTVSSARDLLKPDTKIAPSTGSLSGVSSNQGPTALNVGETFSAGDRVRLLPDKESSVALSLAEWTWGPHDESSVLISEAGMRAQALSTVSFSCLLGSGVLKAGNHKWEIQIQKLDRMWVGIAAVVDLEKCNFKTGPSNFGAPLLAFENDGDFAQIDMNGSLTRISNGAFQSGKVLILEANVEQGLLEMSVDGELTRQIRGVNLKGARPFVCMGNEGIISLGAVLTSDLGMVRSGMMHASRDCLGLAVEGREGIVLDVKKVKLGFSHKTLVKVASLDNGTKAIFLDEALMLADCQSTKHINHPNPAQTTSGVPTACLANGIPADWGTALMAAIKVSTDSGSNGPDALRDMDPQTFWQSNGRQGTHFFELTLNWPVHIQEFGIIVDEKDGNYCPKRVRVFITDSNSSVQDLGSRAIPPGINKGQKAIILVRSSSMLISTIKVQIEDSGGGCDCRVRGLFVLGHPKFELFDHVMLSDNISNVSQDLNLKNKTVGIVVCTPFNALGGGEQRGLIVSSLHECHLNFYRASWLMHSDYSSYVFKLKDIVQLNPKTWENGNPWMESKCLGCPDQLKFGIITHVGVPRGGIQRNIEVVAEDTKNKTVMRSLYSAQALQPASRFCNLSIQDTCTLVTAIENITKKAGERIHAATLVELYGFKAWSKIWKWCAAALGPSAVFSEFYSWLSLLPQLQLPASLSICTDSTALNEEVRLMALSEAKNGQSEEEITEDSFWVCKHCKTENRTMYSRCKICETDRESLHWTCTNCFSISKNEAWWCSFCYTPQRALNDAFLGLNQSECQRLIAWFDVSTFPVACDTEPTVLRKAPRLRKECNSVPVAVCCEQGHPLEFLIWPDSDSKCDGKKCLLRFTEHQKPRGVPNYHCSDCNYHLCNECYEAHQLGLQDETEATTNASQQAVVRCAKGHQLMSQGLRSSGWRCDAAGECLRGISDFFQTASVPNFRCAACDYDLCDLCYDARRAKLDIEIKAKASERENYSALFHAQQWTGCILQHNRFEARLEWDVWIEGAAKEAGRTKELLAKLKAQDQSKPCKQSQYRDGTNGQDNPDASSEVQNIDAEFELNENKRIMEEKVKNPTLLGDSRNNSLRNLVSFYVMKKNKGHYTPLEILDGLISWTDSYGSTVAHHAAFMKLKRSVHALCELGASLWISNKGGETPAALLDGFSSLKENGTPELSSRDFDLHHACCKGGFFDSFGDKERVSFIWKLIKCPKDSPLSANLVDVHRDLFAKDSDTAAVLKTAKSLLSKNCHAHPYLAIAMLRQQYGVKAVSLVLRKYLAGLLETDWIHPLFFYAHYLMWVVQGRPRSGKERCSAVYGIHIFRRFQNYAKEFEFEFDALDHPQTNHDLEGSNPEDCETEDDDDAPGADDPETLWLRAKEHGKLESEAMDKLMALTGLKSVKNSAARVVKEVLLQQSRPSKIDANVSMNFLFLGNPGCGKTTVAQLLAKGLHELGFRSNPTTVETSAQSILKLSQPVQEFVVMVEKAKGGTIFIDEAYRFSPNKGTGPPNDSNHILDFLLEVVEKKEYRDTTTFILAGYKDEIEDLLAYNVGFSSRFSTEFNFEDFTETQLKRIFIGMIKDRGMRLESRKECNVPLAKIVSRRIAQDAGKKGFGNARAVRNKLEEFINNQTHRLGAIKLRGGFISDRDYETLTRTDVIGPRPDYSQSLLINQLDGMVGLKKVKDAVRKLVDLQLQNYDSELAGERRSLISLHRVFYGNPGTGKTTVVKIYGALLKELGLLSKGDFLQCTPADLMGTAVGGAAANTKSLLEKAKGKVLFIDEAYILDPKRGSNPYGGNVLDTLVEKLEGDSGSDIAVILAGYKQEMFDMLENNAGLRRRFNIDDFGIHFEDMSDDELRRVLIRSVSHAGLVLESDEVEDYVVNILTQKKRLPNFGNAGTVQSILSTAKVNRAARISKAEKEYKEATEKGQGFSFSRPNPDILVKSDFDSEDLSSNKKEDPFSKLYNIEHIQKKLEELEALIAAAKADKKDPAVILADCHMVFTGPPGTGKTTVARKFGELFKAQKLLPTDNVIVTSGTNLQGQYVGETKGKVIKLMQQARGGILLIDEAYGLNPGKGNWGYATEAVDTLVGQITEAEFKGNLIVIMAGYANQVNEMFQTVNPGLRSRFDKKRIEFPPWTAAQAADVTVQEIQKDGKTITESAVEELLTCFSEMTKDASWASARDVFETILPAMYSKRAHRMAREKKKKKDDDDTAAAFEAALSIPYVVSDVKDAFEHILGPRVPEIDTTTKLLSSLEEKGKLIVVDYFATWCGPCKKFAPLFAGMKQEFKTMSFYRVDVEKCTEAGEMYEIESIPTTLLYLNGDILMRINGADDRALRKYLNEFIEKGTIESGPSEAQDGHGPSSNLKKSDQTSHNNEDASEDQYADGPSGHQSSTNTEAEINKDLQYQVADEVRQEDPDFSNKVRAALEEGCKELKYSLQTIVAMLRSSEEYTKELIDLIKSKTQCDDESKIRRALSPQKAPFLAKVEELILKMEKEKSEEEKRIQEKIKHMGKCPMDFEWIKVAGGYQCAGGSHFLSDAQLQSS